MAEEDRARWDARHAEENVTGESDEPRVPAVFAPFEDLFPVSGTALDVACGRGGASVWLAGRGLHVCGVDISPVAVESARRLAAAQGVSARCEFVVADLDGGLPPGPPADVVLCHMFREERLYGPMIERLGSGGLLAIAVLSEVGARPGPFRAPAGELEVAFGDLDVLASGEGEGRAWLLARTAIRRS